MEKEKRSKTNSGASILFTREGKWALMSGCAEWPESGFGVRTRYLLKKSQNDKI